MKKNINIEDEELIVPEEETVETAPEADEEPTAEEKELSEAVERYVSDEDEDDLGEVSFKSILGGDLLQSPFFRRQVRDDLMCPDNDETTRLEPANHHLEEAVIPPCQRGNNKRNNG